MSLSGLTQQYFICRLVINPRAHVREGYSSHFVYLSVCLSVCLSVAYLEDGRLLSLQRGINLNRMTVVPLICHFEILLCSREKAMKQCRSSTPYTAPINLQTVK